MNAALYDVEKWNNAFIPARVRAKVRPWPPLLHQNYTKYHHPHVEFKPTTPFCFHCHQHKLLQNNARFYQGTWISTLNMKAYHRYYLRHNNLKFPAPPSPNDFTPTGCCYIQRLASGLADHRGEMKAACPLLRSFYNNNTDTKKLWEARCWWRSWLRHCATSRKVAGSIPDGVTGIFHWRNPSSRTMALGSTQPLTEMSTRNVSWG